MAKISIIIPAYNVSSYLGRCLDSVVRQTFTELEIVVVNDGSTDDSLSIATKYARQDTRIEVVTGGNQGLAKARQKGLAVASSPYIYHLDGDDFLQPNAMELLYAMAQQEDADMVFFDYLQYDETQKKSISQESLYWETLTPVDWLSNSFLGKIQWAVWAHLHKRELYEKLDLGLLDGISMGEDAVLTSMLVYSANKIVKVNQSLTNYVIRKESITQMNVLSDQVYQSYLLFPHRIYSYFSKTKDFPELEKGLYNIYMRAVLETLQKKRYDKAHLICKRAMNGLKKYPELGIDVHRRYLKLIRLFSFSQFIGAYYMRECIRKSKI